jgi:hypothetical protein
MRADQSKMEYLNLSPLPTALVQPPSPILDLGAFPDTATLQYLFDLDANSNVNPYQNHIGSLPTINLPLPILGHGVRTDSPLVHPGAAIEAFQAFVDDLNGREVRNKWIASRTVG